MSYPTMEQVEDANKEQLARWYRYLRSPGQEAIGAPNFSEVLEAQVPIMNRIVDRFHGMGGWDKELSKRIDRSR